MRVIQLFYIADTFLHHADLFSGVSIGYDIILWVIIF